MRALTGATSIFLPMLGKAEADVIDFSASINPLGRPGASYPR